MTSKLENPSQSRIEALLEVPYLQLVKTNPESCSTIDMISSFGLDPKKVSIDTIKNLEISLKKTRGYGDMVQYFHNNTELQINIYYEKEYIKILNFIHDYLDFNSLLDNKFEKPIDIPILLKPEEPTLERKYDNDKEKNNNSTNHHITLKKDIYCPICHDGIVSCFSIFTSHDDIVCINYFTTSCKTNKCYSQAQEAEIAFHYKYKEYENMIKNMAINNPSYLTFDELKMHVDNIIHVLQTKPVQI
jgi:hypothetical protein